MIDTDRFKYLADRRDWPQLYAMLDDACSKATSRDDVRSEAHWRVAALERQQRYSEALDLLRSNANIYNSQSYVQHQSARLLLRLGHEKEALDALSKAPFDSEMKSFYGLAIDAKFLYVYLLAKHGDRSAEMRLPEIPDDYQYVTKNGEFIAKSDIVAVLKGS